MTDTDPLPPLLERLKAEIKHEATRESARAWYEQAKRLEDHEFDATRRWTLLLVIMRRVGWPDR
jgi:hypothetical protein